RAIPSRCPIPPDRLRQARHIAGKEDVTWLDINARDMARDPAPIFLRAVRLGRTVCGRLPRMAPCTHASTLNRAMRRGVAPSPGDQGITTVREHLLSVGGGWRHGGGGTAEAASPSTGKTFALVAVADRADVDAAVTAAHE